MPELAPLKALKLAAVPKPGACGNTVACPIIKLETKTADTNKNHCLPE